MIIKDSNATSDGLQCMTFEIDETEREFLQQAVIQDENEDCEVGEYTKRPQRKSGEDGFFNVAEYQNLLSEFSVPFDEEDENEEDTISPFERKKKNMIDITQPHALVYKQLLKQGSGPPIPEGALVVYNYVMYHEDDYCHGLEPFDSTHFRQKPDRQRLGNALIEGLEIAISSMRKGERSRFILDYRVMFGEKGVQPRIHPKANILAEIEVVNFMERNKINTYFEKTEEEKAELSFVEVMSVGHEMVEDGKGQFQTKRYAAALRKYRDAIDIFNSAPASTEEENIKKLKEIASAIINTAMSAFYLGNARMTCRYCDDALHVYESLKNNDVSDLKHKKAKAHYFKGKALRTCGDYDKAASSLKSALSFSPGSADIMAEIRNNDDSIKKHKETERNCYRRMFQNSTNFENNSNRRLVDLTCKFAQDFETDMLDFMEQSSQEYPKIDASCFNEDEIEIMRQIANKFELHVIFLDNDIQIRKKKF